MKDALLTFSDKQEVTLAGAGNVASERVLKEADIAQLGRGHQKFVEVWTDGNFTDEAFLLDIRLAVGSTSPGTAIMEILSDLNGDTAGKMNDGVGGMIAKVALPSLNLDDFISLIYAGSAAITAGGHLTAFINPEMMG